jgi:hypothetical protein
MGNKSNFCSTCNEENEAILSNPNEKIITQIRNDMSIINNTIIKNNSIGHSFIIPLSDTRDSSPSINLSPINPKKNDINQIQYIGNIIDGKKEGKGKLIYPDGTYYEGNFKNDLYEGEGIYEWPEEGRKYKGEFHCGNIEGNGETQYNDGSLYKGKYIGGIKQGEGSYTWNNGQTFIGNWLNNELHGKGILNAGDSKFEVIYRFGKIISSRPL